MTSGESRAAGDAFKNFSNAAIGLLRQEMRRGEAEMKEKARLGAKGAVLLAAAGVCGGAAVGTGALMIVRLFDRFMGPRASALAATTLWGAAAGLFASWGVRELGPALPILPTDTLGSLTEDLRASESDTAES